MSDEKKQAQQSDDEKVKGQKLNLDELEKVSGGSVKDASKKRTSEISSSTRSNI